MTLLQILDASNTFFELGGAIAAWLNVRSILHDKKVSGINWLAPGFFGAWGLFNLVLYPLLGMWCSAIAGGLVAAANFTWTFLAVRYKRASEIEIQGQVQTQPSEPNWKDPAGKPFVRDRIGQYFGA